MKLIKIGAAWCGPCNAMDKQLEGFDACEFVKYDVDNSDDETLKVIDEYKIRSVPVMILLDDDNNIIKRWNGTTSRAQIEEEIKNHQ